MAVSLQVCVTEMSLYSFAEYARSRGDTAKVSATYGIAFLKSEFYSAGGRTTIYGLSIDSAVWESVLPRSEQCRYVAYSPLDSSKWVD
jgi:hypothetical protein